ncbi:MAG: UvrD-helicase domain-containing protein, partial [Syntrophothermus sp.]
MKERVLESLRALSDPDYPRPRFREDLIDRLTSETGIKADEIPRKAGEAIRLILHHYSDFAIGTIDGFSHRIMRAFARDFGLSVNFMVSLESETLRQKAVDILLNSSGENKELTDLLVHFLETMIEENGGWNIEKIVLNFSKVLEDEAISQNLPALKHLSMTDFLNLARSFNARYRQIREELIQPGRKVTEIILAEGISPDAFYRNNSGFYGYMLRISNGNLKNTDVKKYLEETVQQDKWFSPRASAEDREKINKNKDEFLDLFDRFQELKEKKLPTMNFMQMMRLNLYPLGVLNHLSQLFEDFKRQNNIVQVAEFNRRISAMILNEPVPFIYERMGEKFRNILIDEFQDTSRLQWQNLLPLVENSLSTGGLNLVVGDGKQAIYRWRNGEVEQFVNLPQLEGSEQSQVIKDRENSLRLHFNEKRLDRNFRSRAEIVQFNNAFFGFLQNNIHPDNARVYQGQEQQADQQKPGGFVSLEFLGSDDLENQSLTRIMDILNEVKNLNYQWKDVAILCRDNTHASLTARFLMSHNVDVISAESLLICFSPDVQFMINFLSFLDKPQEKFIHSLLLTWMYRGGLLPDPLPVLLDRLNGKSPLAEFIRILDSAGFSFNMRQLSALPLYDLCEQLLRIFHLDVFPDMYLQFFLDAVLNYTRQNSGGISGFLNWWESEKKNLSVVMPEGLNAVKVMTIHKAKGLQFPIVLFPFVNQKAKASRTYLWIDLPEDQYEGLPAVMIRPDSKLDQTEFSSHYQEEIRKSELDLINMLYVVMTRPEEMLYVLLENPPKNPKTISIPILFQKFLESRDEWSESGRFIYGTPIPGSEKNIPETATKLDSFISENWRGKIRLKSNAPWKWDADDPQRKRSRGNMVHSLLSGIASISDIDRIMDDALRSGLIPAAMKSEISELLMKVVQHPEISVFFKEGIRSVNEAEILSAHGGVFRPDRIVFEDDQVILLDYKTGKDSEYHQLQLQNYGKLMLELGYPRVKKYLVYLEPDIKLVEVI